MIFRSIWKSNEKMNTQKILTCFWEVWHVHSFTLFSFSPRMHSWLTAHEQSLKNNIDIVSYFQFFPDFTFIFLPFVIALNVLRNYYLILFSGFGYGLPISRLYARYFHGDISLLSCEGYGTDTVIYMKVRDENWKIPRDDKLTVFSNSACQMKLMNCYQYSIRLVRDFTKQQYQLAIGAIR